MRYHLKSSILLLSFCFATANVLHAFKNDSESYLDTVNSLEGEKKYFYLIDHLEVINDNFIDTVLFFATEAKLWGKRHKNDNVEGIANLLFANYYSSKSRHDSAFSHLILAEKQLRKSRDSVNMGRMFNEKAYVLLRYGLSNEGINAIESAIEFAYRKSFDVWYVSKSNLAATLMFREPSYAMEILHKLEDTLKKRKSSRLGSVYNKISVLKRNSDSALYFLEQGIEFNRSNHNRYDLLVSLTLMGNYYKDLKQFDKSISYYKRSLAIAKELDSKEEIFNNLNGLSKLYRMTGQLDSGALYLDSMQHLINEYQLTSISRTNFMLAEIDQLYKEEKYKEACDRYTEWAYYRDSLEYKTFAQMAMVLDLKMNDKEKDWRIDLLREINNTERWKFRLLLILVISSIVILSWGFISYARKRRQEKLILRLELEKERERKKRLELENQKRKQELVSKSLQLSKRNQLLEELQAKIDNVTDNENGGDYIKLRNLIKVNRRSDKDWEEIRKYFDQLSPRFYDVLESRSAALSPADKKLAALIHLRIDNQDIANILHIARASVKTARYRLKKKLHLNTEESLDSFLASIE